MVTNCNGKAFIKIINVNESDRELEIPVIRLKEIESVSSHNPNFIPNDALNISALRLEVSRDEMCSKNESSSFGL